MSKFEKFFKNTIIFSISNFSSKILIFLMLPYYTRVLSTNDLGTGDIYLSVVGLLIPLFTLSVTEGIIRFAISKNSDNTIVFSYGMRIILLGFLVLIVVSPVFFFLGFSLDHTIIILGIYIFTSVNQFLNNFTRGINKIKLIGIVGILSTIVFVASNIVLLTVFDQGLEGYLYSYLIMNFFGSSVLFIKISGWNYYRKGRIDDSVKKDMLKFNIPLIPKRISWIIISSSSKYFLIYLISASATGIYSAALRIPSILTAIYAIVQQALLLSVLEEYDQEEKLDFFEKTYSKLTTILLLSALAINISIKPLASFLFYGDFYEAYKLVPFLVIATLFGALHGNITTVFTATKDTKYMAYTSIIGMIMSVMLNIVLIKITGVFGAAIASLLVYTIMWLLLYIKAKKYITFSYKTSHLFYSIFILILHSLVLVYIDETIIYIVTSFLLFMILFILNFNDINQIINSLIALFKNRSKN